MQASDQGVRFLHIFERKDEGDDKLDLSAIDEPRYLGQGGPDGLGRGDQPLTYTVGRRCLFGRRLDTSLHFPPASFRQLLFHTVGG
jgi:hypothetical protein